TSAWALQHLARAERADLSGMVYAGVGLGIAFAGLFCLAAARPGVPASQLWLELGALAALAIAAPSYIVAKPLVTLAVACSTPPTNSTLGPHSPASIRMGRPSIRMGRWADGGRA